MPKQIFYPNLDRNIELYIKLSDEPIFEQNIKLNGGT